ncbi:Unknown protein [Striga hermonthica]|uniref:Uncharacterized protein n=1 Tax=Striga hermonthica TaxID=68872 RepID=A0A9N7NUR1_STRHE|nr:Unknown protein [Striga hermonthica]
MKPRRTTESSRGSKAIHGEGPNWVLIAGSALLSTLSIRLGYKLKQVFDVKQQNSSSQSLKVNGKSEELKKSSSCRLHSNGFCFPHDEDGCYNHYSGLRTAVEIKPHLNGQISEPDERPLSLVTVQASEFDKENGMIWSSASPNHRLELPQKPFHQSNSSESPCVSESGSDIFSKREVIQKLRQQLKKRDDTIIEMQDQITDLQNSLSSQLSHSSQLQSLLDAANRDLFESEREIQRLRKAIADHCVGQVKGPGEKTPTVPIWPGDVKNGYLETEANLGFFEKGEEKVELLKREVHELKELIEGKDYLLQSYKEQKSELSVKIKELQQRLDSQLPNIL